MAAKLEKISIRGYKSIRELTEFSLLPGLNALIGANGAGKSNFIRFFGLLGNMIDPNKGLQNYLRKQGGADAFLFRGVKVTPELSAQLTFGRNQYRFSLQAADDRSMFFSQESAPFKGPMFGTTSNDLGTGHIETRLGSNDAPNGATSSQKWARETMAGWKVYHFHDTSPTAAVMGRCNIVDNRELADNAGNLSAFLLRMRQDSPAHFARVVETVRQVAPFFGEFTLTDVGAGQTQLLWKDRYSDLVFYPHQLSDGTLRYICLAALLLQPSPPATIVIDEPELGLHPFAIKLLASMLQEIAQHTQLIVSTQSSLLIDELTPEQVIVVNHHHGESTLERQDPLRLASWLEEYTLGQLWEKNELGGLP
jgi:predicted ATPase